MKRRYIKLIVLLVLILPSKTKAICNDSKVSQLQKFSQDITYTYTYTEKNDMVTFDITFTNLRNVLSIKGPFDNKYYTNYSEVTFKNLKPNTGYNFEIYATNLCPSSSLKNLYIVMPGYNKYYKDKICEGLEEFKYCQKWINLPFGYERLKSEITKYKESLNKKEEKKEEELSNFDKFKKKISEVYSKYYLVIIGSIVTIAILTMVLNDRRSDFK